MTDNRIISLLHLIMNDYHKDNRDRKISMVLTDNDYTITYYIHYSEKNKKFFDKFNELYAEELALGHVKEPDKDTQSKYVTIENVTMSLNSQGNYLIYHIDNSCAD